MPTDSEGYPVKSYYCEDGGYIMTKAEKEAARAEEERIANGGLPDYGLTDEQRQEITNILLGL